MQKSVYTLTFGYMGIEGSTVLARGKQQILT